MKCYKVIGYYICELCDTPEWLQEISGQILSVSGCIGEQHPRWECFIGGWGKKAIQEYQEKLRLNKEEYIEFSETAKRLFDGSTGAKYLETKEEFMIGLILCCET